MNRKHIRNRQQQSSITNFKNEFVATEYDRFYQFKRIWDWWSLPEQLKIGHPDQPRRVFYLSHKLSGNTRTIDNIDSIQMLQYYINFPATINIKEKFNMLDNLIHNSYVYVCGFTINKNIRFFVPVLSQQHLHFNFTPLHYQRYYHDLYLDVLHYYKSTCGVKYVKSESNNIMECVIGLVGDEYYTDNSGICEVYTSK